MAAGPAELVPPQQPPVLKRVRARPVVRMRAGKVGFMVRLRWVRLCICDCNRVVARGIPPITVKDRLGGCRKINERCRDGSNEDV